MVDEKIENNGNKVVLITGASNGIGYELARLFAKKKYSLVLVSSDEEKLNKAAKNIKDEFDTFVKVIVKDLRKINSAKEIYKELNKETIKINILVNNAGFGLFGKFDDTNLEKEIDMIQVNNISLTQLTKLFLKDMIERKDGKILNVASTAAFQPGPLMAVYYATKSYVLSFSEALAEELKGTGVSVTTLCPGPTKTGFEKRADLEDSKLFKSIKVMESKDVARIGYEGLMKNKRVVIPGFTNNVMANAPRFVPRNFVTSAVKKVQEKSVKSS
jgi:uncharacterized protein